MIVKSITHTSHRANIQNLITYVFSDKHLQNDKGESVLIKNLLIGDREKWAQQFQKVETRRTSNHKKAIKFYHEILSFSPHSYPSKAELEDLIWKYLTLRLKSPTKAFASVHFQSHTHCHVVYQGIDAYGKSVRISKKEFRDLQIRINQYQQSKYPHLSDSVIDYSTPSKDRSKFMSHASHQIQKRTGKPSNKQQLVPIIQECFAHSNSTEAFIAEIVKNNMEVYYRSGKLYGVIFKNRNYRLNHTLGIQFEKLLKPTLEQQRLTRIKRINEKNKGKENERGR